MSIPALSVQDMIRFILDVDSSPSFTYLHTLSTDTADTNKTFLIVLVAGLPLDQKVVQYGPFVLNTQDEVYQALQDFQTHSNGFERAKGWRSDIGKSMVH
jgi:Pirin C-terminal cupin domain